MECDKNHLAHCLLYEFHKGSSAIEACESLKKAYGSQITKESSCRHWFQQFRSGETCLQQLFWSDTDESDEEEVSVPTKIRKICSDHATTSLCLSIDVLTDVLKYFPRKRLGELEEVNSVMRKSTFSIKDPKGPGSAVR
uniref:Mos1 transposase HTH domain-containing protein n=1 Tax=Ditylenchus dipsaci TaxID=166011 RepID=A0A915DHF5_9BILA